MFPIHITVRFSKPPDVSIRQWNEAMREAHAVQGRHWHETMLPRHFSLEARDRYGYQPRGKTYQFYKELAARGKGPFQHQGPVLEQGKMDLVFSGLLRRTMLDPARIRAFPSRVTVTMIGPRYITMRPFKTRQPDKAAEVTAVTPDEQRELDQVLEKEVHQRFANAPEEPLVVKIPA
jgi:hypothetical protein